MVRQDLHQPKLGSNINMMPSNCSRCTHNIQENDCLMAKIAVLQAQLQTQSLGKGNLCVGKDETVSVPPVSKGSSINPLAQSPQPDTLSGHGQDLQPAEKKLSSDINTMPSNCSHCTHNLQENFHFM